MGSINVDYPGIALTYESFDSVSGDAYDFILNRERVLANFVGDATGHGISAALMIKQYAIDNLKYNLSTNV
jgi:serine phosphatase RsbU (regulator of sigma subunit)